MKKTIAEFLSTCRDLLHGEQNDHKSPEQASFEKSYRESLEYVETYKASIAYDMTCDLEEAKFRRKQDEIEQAAERGHRTEQLIDLGKSYSPAAERCLEKAGPDRTYRNRNDFDIDRE